MDRTEGHKKIAYLLDLLCKARKAGDTDMILHVEQEFVKLFMPLICRVIGMAVAKIESDSNVQLDVYTYQDLVQEASIFLIQGIRVFDPSKTTIDPVIMFLKFIKQRMGWFYNRIIKAHSNIGIETVYDFAEPDDEQHEVSKREYKAIHKPEYDLVLAGYANDGNAHVDMELVALGMLYMPVVAEFILTAYTSCAKATVVDIGALFGVSRETARLFIHHVIEQVRAFYHGGSQW